MRDVPRMSEGRSPISLRLDPVSQFGLEQLPSEYIGRHFHFGYMTDTFGLRNLEYMGAERVLWSQRLPPHQRRLAELVAGDPVVDVGHLAQADRELILAGNAQRLYKFGR